MLSEAIENDFVPLAVNNRPGTDNGLLERYEEPQYNNPVVRFFDPQGDELIERRDRVWSSPALVERMVAALERAERPVPPYLALARAELSERLPDRAVFGMHCFWQGQAALGRLDGVLSARPGWLAGAEVVEVDFDPRVIEYGQLVRAALRVGCAQRVFADDDEKLGIARELVGEAAVFHQDRPRDAKRSDDLYHLKRSSLRYLPLTPLQALRINGALEASTDAGAWLSPEQRALAPRVEAALRAGNRALKDLQRPAAIEELGAYRTALLAALEG